MARKDTLKLFLLGVILLIVFAAVGIAIRPAPQELAAVPTLMSLPTSTETDVPTDAPTIPANTEAPPTSNVELVSPAEPAVIANTQAPSQTATETSTSTATATSTRLPTTTQPPSAQPPVIVGTSAPVVVQQPPPPVQNVIVIAFEPGSSAQEQAAYLDSIGAEVQSSIDELNTVIVSVPETITAQSLPDSPVVAETEPDYFATVLQAPDDPLYPQQWGLQAIGAESIWSRLPADAAQVTVAVIDTGICADHPELQGRILDGYDYVDDDTVPQDDFGHGCAVAGVIASQSGNGQGIAGIAPNVQILPLRVLNSAGYGSYSDIAEAIIYAADSGAQVINLSLGGANASNLLEDAVGYAMSRGAQLVAAAGNNSGGPVMYPAAYPPVISVGSVDQNLQPSSFNPAATLDVYAPGRGIMSLANGGNYVSLSGTSLAAPHVSGALALYLALGEPFVPNGQVLSLGPSSIAPTVPPSATPESVVESTVVPTTDSEIIDSNTEYSPTYPVTSDLYQLALAYEQSAAQAQSLAENVTSLQLDGNRVLVDITVSDAGVVPSVSAALGGIGAQAVASADNIVTAFVPIDQLRAATALPGVLFINSSLPPMPVDGDILPFAQTDGSAQAVTQGVVASNANAWHTAGWNGTGTKIAIIDVGFAGYSIAELPTVASGQLVIYQPSGVGFATNDAHGTAVAEIVYDMAPGATIYLATPCGAINCTDSFSATIMRNLIISLACDVQVDVIQSSMFFANAEDGDGTGLVTDGIAIAEDCGALYVQAAGNSAENHWDMAASASNFTNSFGHMALDFDTGIPVNTVLELGSGCPGTNVFGGRIFVGLRWNAWPSTNQDYDLYLKRWNGSTWVTATITSGMTEIPIQSTTNQQANGGAPTEFINVVIPTSGCYGLLIEKKSGASGNHTLDLLGANLNTFEFNVQSRSLVDPATSPDSLGVAAVDVSTFNREWYSSIGPAHASGGTINDAAASQQPRISGFANVTISFGTFNGTSSAAPHVSGAAALVAQHYPAYSPSQIRHFLENRAIDLGSAGYDLDYGMGRLHLGDPNLIPSATPTITLTPSNTPTQQPNTNVNLLVNGEFNAGTANWTTVLLNGQVISGVMSLTPATPNTWGYIAQSIPYPVSAGQPIEFTAQAVNTSATAKSFLMRVSAPPPFNHMVQCSFTIPANSPLSTYRMRFLTPASYAPIYAHMWLLSPDTQGIQLDNLDLQIQPQLVVTTTECISSLPVPSPNTNMISNGDFAANVANWSFAAITPSVTGSVLSMNPTGANVWGYAAQTVPYVSVANQPFELSAQFSNPSASSKTILMRVSTSAPFSNMMECNFAIPANSSAQTYTMQFLPPANYGPMLVHIWQISPDITGVQMDNVNFQYKPSLSIPGTQCQSGAPPANTNLVLNGSFSSGFSSWTNAAIVPSINSGVLTMSPTGANVWGYVAQTVPYSAIANQTYELSLQLGNSSASAKTILLRMSTIAPFAQMSQCSFTIPANSPLQTYSMRLRPPASFSPMLVHIWQLSPDMSGVQMDNVSYQYLPSISGSGVECQTPTPPANINLLVNPGFSSGFANWSSAALSTSVTSGVLTITPSSNVWGYIAQAATYTALSGQPYEMSIEIANSTSSSKTVLLRISTIPPFTHMAECGFTIPANTPMTRYIMRFRPTASYAPIFTHVWVLSPDTQSITMDNANLAYMPSLTSIGNIECSATGLALALETMTPTMPLTATWTATPTEISETATVEPSLTFSPEPFTATYTWTTEPTPTWTIAPSHTSVSPTETPPPPTSTTELPTQTPLPPTEVPTESVPEVTESP